MTDPNQFNEFENDEVTSEDNVSDELFDQLAAEEPPVNDAEDTNPSATKPREAIVPASGNNMLGSVVMLIVAVLMVAIGALLILGDNDDESADNNPTQIVQNPENTATLGPTLTVPPSVTPPPLPTVDTNTQTGELPTAAADEQGLSLLTPVPNSGSSGGSIERDDHPFTEQISGAENDFVIYTVQRGDTLESIEDRFNLELCTIVWSNERNKVSPLQPGNELTIPPVNGVYAKLRENVTISQLAEETGVDPYDIIDSPYNTALFDAKPDSILIEGLQVMVPGGNGGNCNIWGAGPSVVSGGDGDGDPTTNTGTYSLWGCNATVAGGGFPANNPMGGSYVFYQAFSPAHTGVDLSANEGLPVLAAGYGTVVFAGWNQYGYGNTIVIAHGTTFTLYGHLSAINVRCGQDVNGGQTIGAVGNTGNSSGPHLHFEIRDASFTPLNPIYTIGF